MSNSAYEERIAQAAARIRSTFDQPIDWLLVLGSGLGILAEQIQQPVVIDYKDIPGFPESTVEGHAGRLVLGNWIGKQVAVMQGRFHYYEGHPIQDVVLPIRVMQTLGVTKLLLTNAAGGLGEDYLPGDLMLIRDHIGFWAESPLRGPNLDRFGPRFIDQSNIYDTALCETALACAASLGIRLHEGVYAYCKGPQFETPAEIRLLKLAGATAAGMSTVPEAIAATHGGMKVLAISCITNLAAGISALPLSHAEVMETGAAAADKTVRLLTAVLEQTC